MQEALAALLKDQDPRSVPNGAAGLYLTGRAYLLANDANSAARFFEAALRVDPTMWAAYSELCDLHSVERVSRYRARLEGAVKWDAAAGPEPSRSDAFPQDDATPAAATAGAAEPLGRPAAPVKSRLGGRSLQTPAERVRAAIETPDSDLSQGMVEQGDEATPALVPVRRARPHAVAVAAQWGGREAAFWRASRGRVRRPPDASESSEPMLRRFIDSTTRRAKRPRRSPRRPLALFHRSRTRALRLPAAESARLLLAGSKRWGDGLCDPRLRRRGYVRGPSVAPGGTP